jgi:RNA-directed DNA polymerase
LYEKNISIIYKNLFIMYAITNTEIWQKPTANTAITAAALDFSYCRKLKHLAAILEMPKSELKAAVKAPLSYQAFRLPKPDGGVRLIEAPSEALKKIQHRLNFFLQAYYHGIRPKAAYGGLMSATDDREVRNILTNAKQHVKRQWVMNMDLEDFYHQIPQAKIVEILRGTMGISEKVAQKIARLCCFKNRLPMGAPTSCILANFACLDLDKTLETLADRYNLRYTRYIDDLTFSAKHPIPQTVIESIRTAITQCGFAINEKKYSLKHLNDVPEVTGLMLLPNKVDIADSYIKDLKQDITLYKRMVKAGERISQVFQARTLSLYRQHLQGKINFVGFVRGRADIGFLQLKKNMKVMVAGA